METDAVLNRRTNRRVFIEFPLVYEIMDLAEKKLVGKTALATNISMTGIYFETDDVLPLDKEIHISFRLPKFNNDISAVVKTVRIEVVQEGRKTYGIGACFTKISEDDVNTIKQELVDRLDINKLLTLAIESKASDLHLLANQPPVMRIQGEIQFTNAPKLSADDIGKLLYCVMSSKQIQKFEKEKELDFAIQYDMSNRFRVNIHQQRGFIEATLRLINTDIPSFEALKLPPIIKTLARNKDGLILIVGTTGSGKTTTIAAIIDIINRERKGVIITLERPIEYIYANIKSIIKQREIGIDTTSFSAALKSSLRQDPNVIIVGELEDIETIRTAIIAAEAGHLVIASFHAPTTLQAIDRLVTMFSQDNRKQMLFQLSNCLRGIICQLLIPCKDRQKRVLATEVIVANEALKNIIRNDDLIQIPNIIVSGASVGMQSMRDSIMKLYEQDIIDGEIATLYSEEFKKKNLSRI